MKTSTLLIGGGVIAWLLSQKKATPQTPTTPNPSDLVETQIAPMRADTVMGIEKPQTRQDWAERFRARLSQMAVGDALEATWREFAASNENLLQCPTREMFLIAVASAHQPTPQGVGVLNVAWNSTPLYLTCAQWSGWDSSPYWGLYEWKEWHKQLETHYKSTSKANAIWRTAWEDSGKWGYCPLPGTLAFGSEYCQFMEYFWKKGINAFDSWVRTGDYTICQLTDFASEVIELATNVGETAANTTAVLKKVVPIGVAYYLYAKFIR